jgi:hypothetical protein
LADELNYFDMEKYLAVFNEILVVCLTACSASMSSFPRDSPILSNLSKRPSIRKISCDNLSKMTVLSVSCFLSLAIFFSNVAHRIASSSISLGVNSLFGWVGRNAFISFIFLDARIQKSRNDIFLRKPFLHLMKILFYQTKPFFLTPAGNFIKQNFFSDLKTFLSRFRDVDRGGVRRSANPIQTKGADYASHTTASPPDSKSYLHL